MPSNLLSQCAYLAATTSLAVSAGIFIHAGVPVVLYARLLARALLKVGWPAPSYRRATEERRRTLEGLIAGLISLVAIVLATEASGPYTEVTVLANSVFGQAATLRRRLIALIYERLQAAGVTLREF